ncbi:hypothetical protein EMIT0324P_20786 [Pseudomonas chlororaphis]
MLLEHKALQGTPITNLSGLRMSAETILKRPKRCFPPANKKPRRSLIYGAFSLEAEVGIEPA